MSQDKVFPKERLPLYHVKLSCCWCQASCIPDHIISFWQVMLAGPFLPCDSLSMNWPTPKWEYQAEELQGLTLWAGHSLWLKKSTSGIHVRMWWVQSQVVPLHGGCLLLPEAPNSKFIETWSQEEVMRIVGPKHTSTSLHAAPLDQEKLLWIL